ncbi:MAG: hypothetical protein EBY30_17740, partial [Rhodospirillales bacterium]|nr:hypothetical protein [Rhodospirillales bacterium]
MEGQAKMTWEKITRLTSRAGMLALRLLHRLLSGRGHGLRLFTRAALGLAMALGLAAGALAWRLGQGPLELTWLAGQVRQGIALDAGTRLRAESIALAWDGWRDGASALPAIRLDGVQLEGPGLAARADAVLLHVSLAALLRGEIAPSLLELEAPRLQLKPGDATAGDMDAATLLPWLAAPDELGRHMALRGLRVRNGAIALPGTGTTPALALEGINIVAQRGREGLRADGTAALRMAEMQVAITVQATGAATGSEVVLRVNGLRPEALAGLL